MFRHRRARRDDQPTTHHDRPALERDPGDRSGSQARHGAASRAGRTRRAAIGLIAALPLVVLAACGSGGTPSGGTGAPSGATAGGPQASGGTGGEVRLVTHDSFALSKESIAAFEQKSGYKLTQFAPGGGGELVNQLILTKSNPLGDVAFGVDNTTMSKAIDAGVFAPYTSPAAGAEQDLAGTAKGTLTAIDYSDVCINIDHAYFKDHSLPEPVTLADLARPQYKDLLVVTNPASSTPGMAFLLATIAAYGKDGWQGYWRSLVANGVKIDSSWTDAYSTDFSGSEGKGLRPLALSYSSSPPAEVLDGASTAPTGALLDTCYRQVEFAGVLAGAKNPAGAKAVVDWLLSDEVQSQLPDQMYVYPAVADTTLPKSWAAFAPPAPKPYTLPPAEIAANSQTWLEQWTEIASQ